MKKDNNIEINKIGNEHPFTLPEGYFSDFSAKMDKLVMEEQPQERARLHPWMYGVAASLIGVVLLGQVYMTHRSNGKLADDIYDTYILSQVNEAAIIDYYLTSADE